MILKESFKGAVETPFGLRREVTSGKLASISVVLNTFTTHTFPRTAWIGAGAIFKVFVFFTVHLITYFNIHICTVSPFWYS